MITDEERREVARRLRAIYPDDFSSYSEEHECVEKALGIWDDFDKFLWHVVADLIEPTPKSSDIGLTCDCDALLDLADRMEGYARFCKERSIQVGNNLVECYARRIRDAVDACEACPDAPVAGDEGQDATDAYMDDSEAAEGYHRVDVSDKFNENIAAIDFVQENGGLEAVKARLMPEGMEWPKVDGKPVDFVTGYEPSLGVIEAVSIYNNGACEVMSHDGIIKPVSEIHIAVLAADGEPLEVGQTVWHIDTGDEFHVSCFSDGTVNVSDKKGGGLQLFPSQLTHQRPVLDADGVPIKEGDTVYLLPGEWCDRFPCYWFYGGEELEVFADGEARHVPGGVKCRDKRCIGRTCYPQPSQLTHERPDTWQSLYDDTSGCGDSEPDFKEFVRRAKALAERGER